jgi:hypothetical protein
MRCTPWQEAQAAFVGMWGTVGEGWFRASGTAATMLPVAEAEAVVLTEIAYGVKATRYSATQINVGLTQAQAIENLAANGYVKSMSKDGAVTIMTGADKVYRFYPASTGGGVSGATSGVPSASVSILDKIVTKLRFIGKE